MLVSKSSLVLALSATSALAWAPSSFSTRKSSTVLFGYLDHLSKDAIPPPEEEEDASEVDRSQFDMAQEDKDRYGVGDWKDYVEFEEFDGGDGQMGVAGDGKKGLDAEWKGEAQIFKSRDRSAKNAWGTSTGYAEELKAQGVEASRAQQLENWQNQRELKNMRNQQKFMTDQFDAIEESGGDEDWRTLSKFGVERNQDFDMDETFGAVTVGNTVYHHFELSARVGQADVVEFNLLNSFMGYSDFRARFTPETPLDWSVEPTEGSLNGKKGTDFTVKFRPNNPGVATGYLVIQTEDDKWTFQLTGSGSM